MLSDDKILHQMDKGMIFKKGHVRQVRAMFQSEAERFMGIKVGWGTGSVLYRVARSRSGAGPALAYLGTLPYSTVTLSRAEALG